MACDDADTISDAVLSAAAGPKRVKGDAGEVEQYGIAELIEAERYQRSKCASVKSNRGLRFSKLVPPGAV